MEKQVLLRTAHFRHGIVMTRYGDILMHLALQEEEVKYRRVSSRSSPG